MLIIKNALLYTITGENNVIGSIVVENGKIKEVGSKVNIKQYKGAEVIALF